MNYISLHVFTLLVFWDFGVIVCSEDEPDFIWDGHDLEEEPTVSQDCLKLPSTVLTQILGPAYNSRYMSISLPQKLPENKGQIGVYEQKRRPKHVQTSFYVDDTYYHEISDKPAWEIVYTQSVTKSKRSIINEEIYSESQHLSSNSTTDQSGKRQRRNGEKSRPWECESRIKWVDLGPNYFPRFLRSVECTQQVCWYGHYTCRPKSFTVKILHRRPGECVKLPDNMIKDVGTPSLPYVAGELWMWEERAVTFCCDCTIT